MQEILLSTGLSPLGGTFVVPVVVLSAQGM